MARTVTSALMGDPPPGRTPWASASPPSQPAPVLPSDPLVLHTPPRPPGSEDAAATPPPANAPHTLPAEGSLRRIEPLQMDDGLEPPPTGEPIFERIDPRELLVEESYQRSLGDKSIALITRIAREWDWRKFRPPIVVFASEGAVVVDGQHTATAAASRPDIHEITVQVVEAETVQSRAQAFVGLNRDRLGLSPMQLHVASVAAKEALALKVEFACRQSGVTLVRSAFGGRAWAPGDTVAIGAVQNLLSRQGVGIAVEVLKILAEAGCAPVTAAGIKAVDYLMATPEFADEFDPPELIKAIQIAGAEAEKDAKRYAADHCVPMWRGLASVWFQKTRKRRKA